MIDTAMPHNKDAEYSIISTCLCEPSESNRVCDIISPDDIYTGECHKIFSAIYDITTKGGTTDFVTVADRLTDVPASRLVEISENHPVVSHPESVCKLVSDYKSMRSLIEQGNALIKMGQGRAAQPVKDSVEVVLGNAESAIGGTKPFTTGDGVPVSSISNSVVDRLEYLNTHPNTITGIPTGFYKLDKMTAGLQDSDLIILAGRPAMGKTALAMNIVENATGDENVPGVVFTLEMSKEQLFTRALSSKSRINAQYMKTGQVPKNMWGRLIETAGTINDWPLYINEHTDITIGGIRRAARNLKRKHGIKYVIIDYIQLIETPNLRRRDLEIGDISRGLKTLAKELDIPVIALSQLNRKLEERADKRPVLADLRESGALEQDADIVLFLYRDEVYNKDENNPKKGTAELIVSKQRNGPIGTVPLIYLANHVRFENPSHHDIG